MPSLFAGFDTARSALTANQIAIEVIGHNISNVNTPGYTRQVVTQAARQPYSILTPVNAAASQLGTGVDVTAVTSVRNQFIETQLQRITGQSSDLAQYSGLLDRVQAALSESGGDGLSSSLSAFFNAFQTLAQDPAKADMRATVLQTATALTQQFKSLGQSLQQMKSDAKSLVATQIDQANKVAKQIAGLNVQISNSISLGQHPNDLEDQRQELAKQLSDLVGAQTHYDVDAAGKSTGSITMEVGGWTIVSGPTSNTIPGDFSSSSTHPYLTDGITSVFSPGGQVGGLVKASGSIDEYSTSLNDVAATLIQQVNQQHEVGYGLDNITGRAFFSGSSAGDIALAPEVANNSDALAAASPPGDGTTVASGNGDNARLIGQIADLKVKGNSTIGSLYASLVTRIGSDVKSSTDRATTLKAEADQVQNMRNSTSGVSLDEEMTNMMQYQRSYQAAARMLTTLDGMIQSLLTAVGAS